MMGTKALMGDSTVARYVFSQSEAFSNRRVILLKGFENVQLYRLFTSGFFL